ncbi:MAG: hypothetical protein E6J20_19685 [Chloroflexi bacterium]|nr:MAG: hypothetical protein E6J20_19685 [Chloroflexota bacterium]
MVITSLTDADGEHELTRVQAVVDTRHLRIAIAEAAQGLVPGSAIDTLCAEVAGSPDLVDLGLDRWTTRSMRAAEQEVRASALAKAREAHHAVPRQHVATAIANARVPLSEDQANAVVALTGHEGIALLSAPAGAGKGEVLRAVADAHRRDGRRVLALAAAGETAQRLGRELDTEATTVDALVRRAAAGLTSPGPHDLLVIDEAALLETRRWQKLLAAAGPAKVVAVGDGRQLAPIEAGGMWTVLTQGVRSVELTENYRAQDEWARDAWSALRRGDSRPALRAYADRGLIRIEANRAAARETAVALWDERRRQSSGTVSLDRRLLLTDGSNVEVDQLNRLAQEARQRTGELGTESVHVLAVEGSMRHLREEDLHAGDLVSFRRAVAVPGSRRRIENGQAGTVTAVDPDEQTVTVRLRDREVTVDGEDLSALRLAYAQHVYSAQGRTVDEVYVVTGGWQTDRSSSYVAVSRAREASHVISDYSSLGVDPVRPEEALAELADRFALDRDKTASVSLAPDPEPQLVGDVAPVTSATVASSLSDRWAWTSRGTAARAMEDALTDRLLGTGSEPPGEQRSGVATPGSAVQVRQRPGQVASVEAPAQEPASRPPADRDVACEYYERQRRRDRERERERDHGREL